MKIINPRISVLLPVYNGEKYIRETIESVLNQTYVDFELIIINDCSTDKTEDIILSFEDSRIKYYTHLVNKKLISTLNEGLEYCKGEYIARIDADDIMHTERLKIQVQYLDKNPDIILLGTYANLIVNNEITNQQIEYYNNHNDLKFAMCFYCPIVHPTIMLRSNLLKEYQISFDTNFTHAEDYALWTRLIHFGRIENLPLALTSYRIHSEQISSVHIDEQKKMMNEIQEAYISHLFSEFSNSEISIFFDKYEGHISFNNFIEVFKKFQQYNKVDGDFKNRYILKKIKNFILENETVSIFQIVKHFNFIFVKVKLRLTFFQFLILKKRFLLSIFK